MQKINMLNLLVVWIFVIHLVYKTKDMKQYNTLNINEKINLKGNFQSKGIKYGNAPKGWAAMNAPAVWMDTLLYPFQFNGLTKY